ncbi:MAG: hypothetical protein VXB01_16525 [Opitutae bacterium]
MTNKETAVASLKEKTTAARHYFRAIKKNTYFAQIPPSHLETLAYRTTSAKVCEILACHKDREVRFGVAMNPQASYNTLLFLLTDRDKEVSRRVMSWGKLKPADFVALSESFAEGVDHDGRPTLLPTGYFQVTKINLKFRRCWFDSQSYRIMHNPHIGQRGLRSIDINGFRPLRKDYLQEFQAYKRKKIELLKSGKRPLDWRSGAFRYRYRRTWQISINWELTISEYMSTYHSLCPLGLHELRELEAFLLGDTPGRYKEAQLSAMMQEDVGFAEWGPHPLMGFSLKSDRKLAQSESLGYFHIVNLLESYDARTVRYVLSNPSTEGYVLWDFFDKCPSYILNLPNFRTWMARPSSLSRGYEHNIAFILKRIPHCRGAFARRLLEVFEIALTTSFPTDIFEEFPEWIEYISLLSSHPSTNPDTLLPLRSLLEQYPEKNSLHSDNFKIAISERLRAFSFGDTNLFFDFVVYLQERGSELYESNLRPSEFRKYMEAN